MPFYDIIVLGCLYPRQLESEIIDKSRLSTLQFSASAHLNMLLDGIEHVLEDGVRLFNIIPIGSYPKRYTDLHIPEFEFSRGNGKYSINVGYCNMTILKQFSKARRLKAHIKKWAKNDDGRKKIIIVYSLEPEFLSAVKEAKRLCKCHVCQIVTDLPEYTDIDKGGKLLYRLATKYRVQNTEKKIKMADSFVFLAEPMADYFHTDKPYVLMEGLVNRSRTCIGKYQDDGIKYIVYTGSLTKKYGIMDLVNAFLQIKNENYRLVICGSGEAETEIKALPDKRIIFKGALTHEEAQQCQERATLLVNPRNAKEEFTKYSFPSKIMEYMMAGRPVLCFKLPAIPNEYDRFLNYFDDNDISQMAKQMIQICEKSEKELFRLGEEARNFVISNKNEVVQAKRVLDMIFKHINE